MKRFRVLTALAAFSLSFAAGCDDDASPAPTPAPAPAPAPLPDPAPAPPETSASDVMDRESLEAFVAETVAALDAAAPDDAFAFLDANFRDEGDWKVGDIYIFAVDLEGNTVFHGGNQSLEGQNLIGLTDLNGVEFVAELIDAASAGGGFVEYWFDNPDIDGDETHGSPKVGYAVETESGGQTLAVGSGFYPRATAVEVTDRETLKTFVDLAHSVVLAGVSDGSGLHGFLDATFAPDGDWHAGEVYLFAIQPDGPTMFHAANRSLEGQDLTGVADPNGVLFVDELIMAAARGGDFVDYQFDNPEIDGDEDDGSPKVGYAVMVTVGDTEFVLGSGFYPVQ